MNTLTEVQKAYIAGAIDGEGHIGIAREKSKSKCDDWDYHCNVVVSNTNFKFLNMLKDTTNIGIVNNKSHYNDKHKKSKVWELKVHEMPIFLNAILPYLIIKNRQAELMIEFRETYEIKYTWSNPPPLKILVLRELIYEEMIPLNKRGPVN